MKQGTVARRVCDGAGLDAIPRPDQADVDRYEEYSRQKIKADKKLLVSTNLELTEAEAKAFWPVYDAYQADLTALNARTTKLVTSYAAAYNKGPIAAEDGQATAHRNAEHRRRGGETEAELRSEAGSAVPVVKVARYLQESKARSARSSSSSWPRPSRSFLRARTAEKSAATAPRRAASGAGPSGRDVETRSNVTTCAIIVVTMEIASCSRSASVSSRRI